MHKAFVLSYQLGMILFIFGNILETILTTVATIIYENLFIIPQIYIKEHNDGFEAQEIQHTTLIFLKIL